MEKDTQKMKDEIFNLECELARLKGDYLGTLKGILFWDGVFCQFPSRFRDPIQSKINELEGKKEDIKTLSMVELEEIFWNNGYKNDENE